VIVADARLDLLFANPKARMMLGLPRRRGQTAGNLAELIPEDNPLAEIIGSLRGRPREIDAYESPYGRQRDRFVELSTVLMRGAGGGIEPLGESGPTEDAPHVIILLQDVTERRLRLAEQARATRLASLSTLTSGIAHEIKNPLNSLNIHAQLLEDEARRAREAGRAPSGEKVGRAAEVILEETRRVGRIVDDFIQAARPRQPDLQERPLGEFIQAATRIFGPECRQAGIALAVTVEPDLPPVAFDDHLLMQALRNLVRNAIEALAEYREKARAEDPGWTPTLEISAAAAGDSVNLSVGDNGPGMDAKTLEQIFEPYFTTKFQGTGLGLMVVYRIVTEHRAAMNVDSAPGAGTRFTIALPLGQKPVRLLEHDDGAKTGAAPGQAETRTGP
jgi:signal transduction histidine kinase